MTVVGNSSYSCGSGFVHSQHTWQVDSNVLASDPGGPVDLSLTYPETACFDKVYARRDLALVLGTVAVIGAVSGLIVGSERKSPRSPRRVSDDAAPLGVNRAHRRVRNGLQRGGG